MKTTFSAALLLALASQNVNAFPELMSRQIPPVLPPSIGESNTGVIRSTNFDEADQFVDVRPGSSHQFVAPGPGDLRGPCPGLNAAANHGFLPHKGTATILETVTGLGDAYNMGADLAAALAVIAVALTGDYTTETWSIGGAFPATLSLGGLLKNPGGISNSHNKYETDSSPGRGDAFLHGGDAVSLNKQNFITLLASHDGDGTYSLDGLRKHAKAGREFSIANNPLLFYAPFAGLVSTAAEEFIINMMSNHSTEQPSGYINADIIKTFFSVKGQGSKITYTPGHEQIPQNWYRRPSTNQYLAALNAADDVISLGTYPSLAAIGGNTNGTNSFSGVDPEDLSGGVYNSQNLLEGNNLGCFTFQFAQAFIPDQLAGLVGDVTPVLDLVAKHLAPLYKSLGCTKLGKFDQGLFNQFPGFKYDPKGESFGKPF